MKINIKQRGLNERKLWRNPRLVQAVEYLLPHALGTPSKDILDGMSITLLMRQDRRLISSDTRGKVKFDSPYDSLNCRKYTITIQKGMGWGQTVKTLAHELTHVAQYVSGRLRTRFVDGVWVEYWCGLDCGGSNAIPYEERPWEVEARCLEGPMQDAFFEVEQVGS